MSLSGLSVPKFDGANYYRQPTTQPSTIGFSTTGTRFVQFEYQLYSPGSAVTGQAMLDTIILGSKTFPAGKFVDRAIWSGFVPTGKYHVSLTYTCNPICGQAPSQYWTKLTVIKDARIQAKEDTGLGTERLWLNAPDTELNIIGTGPASFDGMTYRRPIEAPAFTLSWPSGRQPLNVGFTVNSNQPFRVTTKVGDEVLLVKRGDARTQVTPNLSLIGHPDARSVTVQVDCLNGTPGCAGLYFPNVGLRTPPAVSVPPVVTGGLTLALLGAVALLLGFGPRPRRG
ncbi:hypothetical protein [Deinococcus sp. Leaf326]|uniref:hypothetical protein n=1 Tax=Deinococcus sp. Leaf326 TaxID=1736338 RepID=UPI0012E2F1EA|nr:hypothetical protein [Deinococcus sp. Leaf326]